MEDASYHRHDIEDRSWDLIKDLLPGQRGQWGGVAEDNRRFINAVFWVLRTGAPWRDLPPDYGGWKNTHRRFCRWRDKGVWERLLEDEIMLDLHKAATAEEWVYLLRCRAMMRKSTDVDNNTAIAIWIKE